MKRYYSKPKSKVTASRKITSAVSQDGMVNAVDAFLRAEELLRKEIAEYRKTYPEGGSYLKDLNKAMGIVYSIVNIIRYEKPYQQILATTTPETDTAGTLVVEVGYAQEPERKEEILDLVKFEIGEIIGLQPYRVENKDTRFTKQYTLFYSPAMGQDYYDIENQLGTNVVLTQYLSGLDFDQMVGDSNDTIRNSNIVSATDIVNANTQSIANGNIKFFDVIKEGTNKIKGKIRIVATDYGPLFGHYYDDYKFTATIKRKKVAEVIVYGIRDIVVFDSTSSDKNDVSKLHRPLVREAIQYLQGLNQDSIQSIMSSSIKTDECEYIQSSTTDFSYTEKLVNEEVLNTFPQFDNVYSTISYSDDGYAYCETYCYSDTNPDLNIFVDAEAYRLDEVASEVITEIRNQI